MVKPLLTASPCDACAPFLASLQLGKHPLTQPHSIPLCLTPTLFFSFPRNAGIPPQFKHVGPHPGPNRTRLTSLVPASRALECAAAIFSAPPPSAGLRHFQAHLRKNNGHGRSQRCRKPRASHRAVQAERDCCYYILIPSGQENTVKTVREVF